MRCGGKVSVLCGTSSPGEGSPQKTGDGKQSRGGSQTYGRAKRWNRTRGLGRNTRAEALSWEAAKGPNWIMAESGVR